MGVSAHSECQGQAVDRRPPTPALVDFRVDGWLIRPWLGIASRDDVTVHVRPQLVDLLVFLARRDGRLATRREILAAVWPCQYVAETCLSRCVAELRHVLGDDAKSPRVIETVLKRGYRLLAPIEWLPEAVAAPVGSQAVTSPLASCTAHAGPPDEYPSHIEPLPLTLAQAPVETIETTLGAASVDQSSCRRRLRPAARLLATGLLLALSMATAGHRLQGSGMAARRVDVVPQVLLNGLGAPLDEMLRLALAVSIERTPYLRVAPDARGANMTVPGGGRLVAASTAAARVAGCDRQRDAVLVSASFASFGRREAVLLEASSCADGAPLAREFATADGRGDLLATLDRAVWRLSWRLSAPAD